MTRTMLNIAAIDLRTSPRGDDAWRFAS